MNTDQQPPTTETIAPTEGPVEPVEPVNVTASITKVEPVPLDDTNAEYMFEFEVTHVRDNDTNAIKTFTTSIVHRVAERLSNEDAQSMAQMAWERVKSDVSEWIATGCECDRDDDAPTTTCHISALVGSTFSS